MVQTLISRTQRTAAAMIHTGGVFKPVGLLTSLVTCVGACMKMI